LQNALGFREEIMAAREPVGRFALASLFLALGLVVLGKSLELSGILPFWGGLIAAFGEAALIGGLADWFAVRALFTHPFGIPFPHTAVIPRNRRRIIAEIRQLVLTQWLPRPVLVARVQAFDFVGQALLPAVPTLRLHLRDLIRTALREILQAVDPRQLATLVAGGVSAGIDSRQLAPWLAELVRRAREHNWLEPVLYELVRRLDQWATLPTTQRFILRRLEHAATTYRERGAWKDFAFTLGEIVGGIDLDEAASALQAELRRFATDQVQQGSQMQAMLHDGLASIERRLRDDPTFFEEVSAVLQDSNTLVLLLERLLLSLRTEATQQIEAEDSPWVDMALRQVDRWLERLSQEPALRDRVNAWCRQMAVQQIEQHHALLGALVEEQMERLTDRDLSNLIQARVGEDLNWIRLNGTFVGGLVGVVIYLLVTGAHYLSH
jgi:uncharacterized membrane-anchored protein YjiN (DUF445 family)